jgi:hypothetical protein
MSEERDDAGRARGAASGIEIWVWFCVTVLPWITFLLLIAWALK